MSLYVLSVAQYDNMLNNVTQWLDKAVSYAGSRPFDPAVLLTSRLAPDQFPLLKQIQIACDTAKNSSSLLAGREPPKHPDTEQTLEEIRARVATVRSYLQGFAPGEFAGAEARVVNPAALHGKAIRGIDYLANFALPNFCFHVSTTYAILRHNGVPLGKRDYLGNIKFLP